MLSLYLSMMCQMLWPPLIHGSGGWHQPFIVNGLDDEAKRRADGVDILSHDLLDNCRLSCIVESSGRVGGIYVSGGLVQGAKGCRGSQHKDPHLLVFESCFSQN